ncbi:hypothetical protein TERTU_3304 [Teredinibacter turnerae T7901]|uniref:Uncharacterized protein n=1 Tax=Teredinibacter turnerae (strain ATCC 39867 / T7901) TaxID=377629 RepID=C5BQH6_TERTT|nr:hypothetical protein TERTU_3304 [Teredinibacter turnerae T7901]
MQGTRLSAPKTTKLLVIGASAPTILINTEPQKPLRFRWLNHDLNPIIPRHG